MKKEELKDFCKSIGIDCVGIAGVGPYYDLEKIIKQRLFNGYTTGMEEPIIEKRVNPKETMENVKSIIVCAFPYYIGNFNESNLSKYCYGEDYHIVVKDMLQQICNHLSDNIDNFDYKIFADNGPLVDRYLAYLSGIGYFGINNNIITDEYGSYVFIGYILTNYEFQSDTPLEKTCIKCGKCVKYCPGNALLGNYEMNPKRCLSYITQKKGDLEEEEEKVLKENKKVFGCDITSIERFKQDTILKLDAEEINDISNKEFKRRYGNRAFSWRGKNIIKRNINIVSEKPNE